LAPAALCYMGTQLPPKGSTTPPIFGPCLLCQRAEWIKLSLGTEVDLGPCHIVLDGAQLPPRWTGAQQPPPLFDPCLMWPNGRPSELLLSSGFIVQCVDVIL